MSKIITTIEDTSRPAAERPPASRIVDTFWPVARDLYREYGEYDLVCGIVSLATTAVLECGFDRDFYRQLLRDAADGFDAMAAAHDALSDGGSRA